MSIDWTDVFNVNNDVNLCYDSFISRLSEVYNHCFPLVRISRKAYKNKSWFSTDLRKELYEKNRLYKIWLTSVAEEDKTRYLSFKRSYNKMCREAKVSYYKNLLNVKSSSIRKIWKSLNDLLGKSTNSSQSNVVDKLLYNNVLYENKLEIANMFNQYFVNVGGNLANALPNAFLNFKNYLGPSYRNSIYVNPISNEEVFNLINTISGGKAAGDDGFNLELIKNNSLHFVQPLTYIYNLSLFSGVVPNALKLAKVIPLFKKDDEKIPSNYRPISLLSILNKILEKLISKRLYDFFNQSSIF